MTRGRRTFWLLTCGVAIAVLAGVVLIARIRPRSHSIIEAVRNRDLEALDRLISAGGDPNISRNGVPLISLAVGVDDFRIVQRLLRAGADPNTRGPNGDTPLTSSLMIGVPVENIHYLLTAGASPTLRGTDGHTPLEAAAAGGTPQHIQAILDAGAPFGAAEGYSALHWAVTFDKVDNVKFLLKHGVDPNGVGPDGLTVLEQFANSEGRVNSLEALLDAGADPDRPEERGLTARKAARNASGHEFIDLLETRERKKAATRGTTE